MGIEQSFRRFQDFGLFAGLIVAITAVGFVFATAFEGTTCGHVARMVSVVCVVLCLFGVVGAMRLATAPLPWMTPRSLKSRLVAGAVVAALSVGCILLLFCVL